MTDEEGEERANLYQRINALESLVSKMTKHRTNGGLNQLSLSAAYLVEDQFAGGHDSRSQRLAKVQIIIREAIRETLTGERKWDAWRPDTSRFAPYVEKD